MKVFALYPHATSAVMDGEGSVVNGAAAVLGSADNDRAFIRFATDSGTAAVVAADILGGLTLPHGSEAATTGAGAIPANETIVYANLRINVTAKDGTAVNLGLYAANFGAALANADYLITSNNHETSYRVYIDDIFDGADATGVYDYAIPPDYIPRGAGAYADFILWPNEGDPEGETTSDTVTIDFSGAADPELKPVLVLVTQTQNELDNNSDYRWKANGSEGYLAFDVETVEGRAVKAKYLLDVTSSDLDSAATNLASNAINRNRARYQKMAVGRAGAGGYCNFDATPEKCWKLLLSFFKFIESTTVGSVYRKVLKVAPARESKTFTFVKSLGGGHRYVYPGTRLGSLSISASLDSIINVGAQMVSIDEYGYFEDMMGDDDAQILSATAGYDTESPLSFVGGMVIFEPDSATANIHTATTIGHSGKTWATNEWAGARVKIVAGTGADVQDYVVASNTATTLTVTVPFLTTPDATSQFMVYFQPSCKVQNVNISIDQALEEVRGIARKRGSCGTVPGSLMATVDFQMYFENENVLRKFLGSSNRDFPMKAGKTLEFERVDFYFAGEEGEQNQELIVSIPKMTYTVVRKPLQGDSLVMLQASGASVFSPDDDTNISVTIVNSEAAAQYSAPESTDRIRVLPFGVQYDELLG